jgi:cell division protease FtsH
MKKGGAMQAMSFGNSKARFFDPKDKKNRITFDKVAGAKEAKQELMEVVDFLKNPKKYLEIGAEIPKGVLMTGAPGTGKTLLARAVAGEAGVPFFSISGSEFIEMFVGVGASRVRDLFKNAKKMAPAIIFIDEIDAIGRTRGGGMGGGNDEREQTLNQILVEMDGFDDKNQVIIMAATNRPEILDKALLRPGRFDRRVTIDLPDKKDREKILEIHGKKKPFEDDVDLTLIAQRTPGFSGADLFSLMNEAAILAASENRKKVAQNDLIKSIEKVLLGPERKSHIFSENEKLRTAYHEVGHALVASVLEHADPVHKITIISRGNAGGYTLNLPFKEKKMTTKKDFEAELAVFMGGYAAEKMIFDDVTTGPSNDLQVSTRMARDMVVRYGMSEKIGVLAIEGGRETLAGSGDGIEKRNISEKTAELVDEEIKALMDKAYKTTEGILTRNKQALHEISKTLKDREVLERSEYEELLKKFNIKIKTEEDQEKLFQIKK